MRILFLILCLLYIPLHKNEVYCLNVTSEDFGTLIGSTTKTAWTQQTIFQFLGVRFAQSPSGSRRFKVCDLNFYISKLKQFFVCFIGSIRNQFWQFHGQETMMFEIMVVHVHVLETYNE